MEQLARVAYREARYIDLLTIDPKRSILVLDTSALPHENMNGLCDYISAGGSVVLERRVAEEIENHGRASLSPALVGRTYGTSDTRNIPRIALNGKNVLNRVNGNKIDVDTYPLTVREREHLSAVCGILPKHLAYTTLEPKFRGFYDALSFLLEHHQRTADKPVSLSDLRGSGRAGYDVLDGIISPKEDLSDNELACVEHLSESREEFLETYRAAVNRTLRGTASAPLTLYGKRKTAREHLAFEANHAMDSLLLRMLGYQLDPQYLGRPDHAIRHLDHRFRISACAQETDKAVVLASYVPAHAPEKEIFLLSSDNDLRFLLRIRQLMAEKEQRN